MVRVNLGFLIIGSNLAEISITGEDSNKIVFRIDDSNASIYHLSLNETASFEVKESYSYTINANKKNGNGSYFLDLTLTITSSVDNTPPVITVLGDNPMTVELGSDYTDAGATSNGGETVTPTGSVDTSELGTYIITYTATDANSNTGTATRTVNVVDTTAPVITVLGDNPMTVELGSDYTDAGATSNGGETVTPTGSVDTSELGTYIITYTATDANSNTGTATRTVNVVDTTAPVITVLGDNPMTVELGSDYTDAGATSNGGETVTPTGSVDTSELGTYIITYTATDANSNTGTATRTVNVVDTTAPVITVLGDNPMTVELGSDYTDAGATSNGGETVTPTGSVDTSELGTYIITYTATDANSNTGTATRTVNVVDTTAPVITVLGDNPMTVELGSDYTDAGATSNGGETVTPTGSVDTSELGTYIITYTATDANSNTGTATRTVNVVDTTAPVITVLGDNPMTVELGSDYTDAGATSNGGETVTPTGSVDTSELGTYIITYTATDANSNTGTATRTVNVVDTTAPVITVLGDNPMTVELGSDYTDAGATSNGGETVTPTGSVDTSELGTYIITYTATDANSNTGTATRTVNVVDTTAPVITVLGDNPMTVELGSDYTDAGATSNGGETVTPTGSVDTSELGTYIITYTATDANSNTGTATRTVNVVDTTAPVITVLGDNPMTVELGSDYTDAGATSNGGETVTPTGSVDTSELGTYIITYTATDANSNTGTATRTVNVVDTTAPVITVLGDNPMTVELGSDYTDAGATSNGGETVTPTGSVDTSELGTYIITYTATDANSNTGTATRTVNVVDTTAPVITVLGDNPMTVELGSDYTDAGATSNGGETVTPTGSVDTSELGTYIITYTATDANSNTGTATRTVNVVDTTAPVITLEVLSEIGELTTSIGSIEVNESVTFFIEGPDSSHISISNEGVLTLNAVSYYNDKTYYNFKIIAKDISLNSSDIDVIINVLDEGYTRVCHIPSNDGSEATELYLKSNSLQGHLNHGDTLGRCGGEDVTPPVITLEGTNPNGGGT
jgi:hypothetical protein